MPLDETQETESQQVKELLWLERYFRSHGNRAKAIEIAQYLQSMVKRFQSRQESNETADVVNLFDDDPGKKSA
jgi:hypothetical protein